MKNKSLTLLVFIFLPTAFVFGQQISKEKRVANYSIGTYGSVNFEHLSFWIEGEKRAEIIYSYGGNDKEIKLIYKGRDTLNGASCFKVQFPNGLVLNVIPSGLSLKLVDSEGKYSKTFKWKYEGPVNGIGTICEPCVANEKEAMAFIKKYFLR